MTAVNLFIPKFSFITLSVQPAVTWSLSLSHFSCHLLSLTPERHPSLYSLLPLHPNHPLPHNIETPLTYPLGSWCSSLLGHSVMKKCRHYKVKRVLVVPKRHNPFSVGAMTNHTKDTVKWFVLGKTAEITWNLWQDMVLRPF